MSDPFSSSRLTYRAVDNPKDFDFVQQLLTEDYIAIQNSREGLLRPHSRKDVEEMLRRLKANEGTYLRTAICLRQSATDEEGEKDEKTTLSNYIAKANSTPIGVVALNGASDLTRHSRHGSIGITLLKSYQGQGYGTEAIEWILRWGFMIAGLHRIEINTYEYNNGALRLYRKMGFVLEARKRECIWWEGRWWDKVEYGMLEGEWREREERKKGGKVDGEKGEEGPCVLCGK